MHSMMDTPEEDRLAALRVEVKRLQYKVGQAYQLIGAAAAILDEGEHE